MKTSLLKSLSLLVSIPLINSILFGIGTIFHEMFYSTISLEQMERYENVMIVMTVISAVSILLIERLYDTLTFDNKMAIVTYCAVFVLIAVLSYDQFIFRPYEHSLTYFSILTILVSRELINRHPNLKSERSKITAPSY